MKRDRNEKSDEKKAPVSEEDDGEFLAAHRVKPPSLRVSVTEKRNASIDAVGALKGVRN
jgi:hypothetical protein